MSDTENNTQENGEGLKVLVPYHDIRSPFSVGEGGAYAEYVARDPDCFPHLTLGAVVVIKDKDAHQEGDIWLTGRIVELRAVSPFNPDRESMLYTEDESMDPTRPLEKVTGPHTHQPIIARIHLDRMMVNSETDFVPQAVGRPPSASSRLWFPGVESVAGAPSLGQILEIKSEGVTLGYVGQGGDPVQQQIGGKAKFLPYKWDVRHLDNKHVSIIGESGSGKTVLLKNLAYDLRKHYKEAKSEMRIIMTDVQGDIAQFLLNSKPEFSQFAIPRKGWQEQLSQKSHHDLKDAIKDLMPCQLVIPVVAQGQLSPNLVALKKLASQAGVTVKEIGLRLRDLDAPSDVGYLFRVASEQAGMLLDEEASALRESGKTVTIPNLRSAISDALRRAEGRAQISSSGGTLYYNSTYYAALRALKSLEKYFDHHQESAAAGGQNPLNCFNCDGTTILYLEELDSDARIMWEMQLVQWLYENKREGWNAFVFFDEAHQIIPAKPGGIGHAGTFERLRVNFENLAREGRKFGINLVLSTQSPRDLHPIVPEQCPTKIVMKISPRNASAAFLDKELASMASRFRAGEFWIQSPFNGTPEWVHVHSDSPPLLHATMTKWWEAVKQQARTAGFHQPAR